MKKNTFGYYYSPEYVDDPFRPSNNQFLEVGIHTINLASGPMGVSEYVVVKSNGIGYTILDHVIIDKRKTI